MMDDEVRAPLAVRLANVVVSYARYLGKAFWPAHLTVYYPFPESWPGELIVASAALLSGVSLWTVLLAKAKPYLLVGWLWFLGTLIPTIGIIHVGMQAMADRFVYVPLIGLGLATVWGVADLAQRAPRNTIVTGLLGGTLLATLIVCTRVQLSHWQNGVTLFRRVVAVYPEDYLGHCNLAYALQQAGQTDEAIEEWRQVLKFGRNLASLHSQIASLLHKRQRTEEAIRHYRDALQLNPDRPEVLNNLAWILATHPDVAWRDGAEAVHLAERACALTNRKKTIYIGTLAAAYAEAGLFMKARETAEEAIHLGVAAGEKDLAAANEKLLHLYQSGQAYREGAK
jgi:hypothetical protein